MAKDSRQTDAPTALAWRAGGDGSGSGARGGGPVPFSELIDLVVNSMDYESALAAVAKLALPEFGAWSIVDLIEPPDSMRRVAIIHPDPEKQELARGLPKDWPPETEDPIGAPVVMRTREPYLVREVTDEMLVKFARSEENLAALRELGVGSYLVLPLVARDEVLGAVTFVSPKSGYQYSDDDLGEAEDLAGLIALIIHNARMHSEARKARDRAALRAEEAQRQRRDLERIMEVQARLVRGFSHDVKNPLGAAMGYADLMEMGTVGSLTPEQQANAKRIGALIHSALDLIEDLVEYASSRLGKVEVRSGPTDLRTVVREIAEEYRAQVEAAGLALQIELPDDLPVIRSDRIRIRQVLGNLLSNAVKYTSEGRVTLGADVPGEGSSPLKEESIAVRVTDTGRGIPPEAQRLLFREFARLEPSETAGAGLGLAISQSVAKALGGLITIESEPGEGSTFTFWLPLVRAEPEEAAAAAS